MSTPKDRTSTSKKPAPKRAARKDSTPLPRKRSMPPLTVEDRLRVGYFSIAEAGILKNTSRTTVGEDIKAGRLKVEQHGRFVRIPGPALAEWLKAGREGTTKKKDEDSGEASR